MPDNANIFTDTSCWVYVLREKQGEGQERTKVAFALTLKDLLLHSAHADLLYYRQFVSISDGLGHKLLLETLSVDSLYRIIIRQNVQLNNLREDFRIMD